MYPKIFSPSHLSDLGDPEAEWNAYSQYVCLIRINIIRLSLFHFIYIQNWANKEMNSWVNEKRSKFDLSLSIISGYITNFAIIINQKEQVNKASKQGRE